MTSAMPLLHDERGAVALKLAIALALAALATHPHRALSAIDYVKTYWESYWHFTAV